MLTVTANGAEIPAIGLGTWRLTGEACIRSVHAALAAGCRHIDTASMYGNEAEVGEAIRGQPVPRADIFVTTKVWYSDAADGRLQRSAENSLKRLGLDCIDLLLIHWPNTSLPVEAQVRALCDARRRGLARHIGVSNFPVRELEAAIAAADAPLVANQVEYHPYLDQSAVLSACRRHGLALVAYLPLAEGKVAHDPVLQDIARAKGRDAAQVALRWLVQQPGVAAIPGSSNPQHLRANMALEDFELTPEEMARIGTLARPDGRLLDPGWAPQWDTSGMRQS
ncbi:MAG TPA: aldo/keto reductase [Afifellaceae bacterium]|nr:aldo/keto reductase [Afifellaceae bacterium]